MAAAEPIRDKNKLRLMAEYFKEHGEYRNYVLIVMGVYTVLRISDLLRLKWSDVYDEKRQASRTHLLVTEQKTKKRKEIALHKQVINALELYFPYRKGEYIFASRTGKNRPISRAQAWRIIRRAAASADTAANISCHSLRKTWGYHAWGCGKISPVVIMDIYNHSSYETTKRYLGVAQDDLDKAYLGVELL